MGILIHSLYSLPQFLAGKWRIGRTIHQKSILPMKKYLLLLLLMVSGGAMAAERHIHDNWRFRQGSSEMWHPAENKQVAALPGADDMEVKKAADVAMERKVLEVKLVNDRRSAAPGTLVVQTLTMDGRKVFEEKRKLQLPANCAIDVKTWRVADILGGERPKNVIIHLTYTTGGKCYDNIAYALRQKEMDYRKPTIKTDVTPSGDGYDVTVSTDRFARAVFLKIKGIDNFFSDNYFDLLPHSSRTIHVRCDKDRATFCQELEVASLFNRRTN